MKIKGLGKIHEGKVKLQHYPAQWLFHAHEFKRTEELIYMDILRDLDKFQIEQATRNFTPSIQTPDKVHYLVMGFAIENLLKCLVLNKHPEIIKQGKIVDKRFKTHNLLDIATKTLNLNLTEDERFMLELSTKVIYWYGRYPIPLNEDDTVSMVSTNRSKIHIAFHSLYERLFSIAQTIMPHHYGENDKE